MPPKGDRDEFGSEASFGLLASLLSLLSGGLEILARDESGDAGIELRAVLLDVDHRSGKQPPVLLVRTEHAPGRLAELGDERIAEDVVVLRPECDDGLLKATDAAVGREREDHRRRDITDFGPEAARSFERSIRAAVDARKRQPDLLFRGAEADVTKAARLLGECCRRPTHTERDEHQSSLHRWLLCRRLLQTRRAEIK